MCLPCKFAVHLLETLKCVRNAVHHFEMVTDSPIDCEPRDRKLQANEMSKIYRVPEQSNPHIDSGNQGISPRATRQCCFHPLPQERCGDQ